MSAINTFAFQNLLCVPQPRCACPCVFAEEIMQQTREPVVTARWMLETRQDGSRRLVRQWFRNEATEPAKGQSLVQ